MITRTINGIEFDIEEKEGNEVYFEEEILQEIGDGELDTILNMFYNKKKAYLPLSFTWELTAQCNFLCPFCYIHTNRNETNVQYSSFLSVKGFLTQLINGGLFICYLTGGECLLHPDFVEIYRFLKSKGVLVVLLTNASLLEEKHFKIFREFKPYKVEVSIYGIEHTFSDIEYDSSRVLSNILRLKEMGINVVCKTPLNKFTEKQFSLIERWCQENGLSYYYSNELFDAYDGTSMQTFKINSSFIRNEIKVASLLSPKRKKLFNCKASKYSFLLSSDLSLRPCFAFHGINDAIFCATEETLFDKLNQMVEYINTFKDMDLKYCKGCEYVEICQECIVTQYKCENLEEHMRIKCENIKTYNKI